MCMGGGVVGVEGDVSALLAPDKFTDMPILVDFFFYFLVCFLLFFFTINT